MRVWLPWFCSLSTCASVLCPLSQWLLLVMGLILMGLLAPACHGLILMGLLTSVVLVSLNFEIISMLMPDHDLVEMSILGRGWAASE